MNDKKANDRRRPVRLPSDYLTEAQRASLSGPVATYKMSPDITQEELATWPADLREMWHKKFGGDAE